MCWVLSILLFHCINNLVVYCESTLERHFVWAEASGALSLKRAQLFKRRTHKIKELVPNMFFFSKKGEE